MLALTYSPDTATRLVTLIDAADADLGYMSARMKPRSLGRLSELTAPPCGPTRTGNAWCAKRANSAIG